LKINTLLLSILVIIVVVGSVTVDMQMEDPNDQFNEELTLRAMTIMILLLPVIGYTMVRNI